MTLSSPNSQTFLSKLFTMTPERMNMVRRVLTSLIALLVFLLIWQLLCSGPDARLPSPVKMLQSSDIQTLITDPFFDNGGVDVGMLRQIGASLGRVLLGFSLATILGVSLGIATGASRTVYDALDPLFQLFRTVPPLAWLPLALAAFRNNESAGIFVIFITSIFPIIINTAVGVQQVPSDYKNVSRVLRLTKTDYFFNILFPATVPYIFTGLRIGIGLSWLAIVAAEMLSSGVGIGTFMWTAYTSSAIDELILAIIYVGIVGFLLDKIVMWLSKIMVPGEQR
jgi:nitrate/nitrite transport system permease protein